MCRPMARRNWYFLCVRRTHAFIVIIICLVLVLVSLVYLIDSAKLPSGEVLDGSASFLLVVRFLFSIFVP